MLLQELRVVGDSEKTLDPRKRKLTHDEAPGAFFDCGLRLIVICPACYIVVACLPLSRENMSHEAPPSGARIGHKIWTGEWFFNSFAHSMLVERCDNY